MTTPFWTQNPEILYINQNFLSFFPSHDMTRVEQLNAITRFAIYALIIFILLGEDSSKWNTLPVTVIIICAIIFYSMQKQKIDDEEEKETYQHDFKPWSNNSHFHTQPKKGSKKINKKCKSSTKQNPYMNPLAMDTTLHLGKACASDIPQASDKYLEDIYQDFDDIYQRKNSERQFYTLPNTDLADSRDNFINLCYRSNQTCKDRGNCNLSQDLRFQK